MPLTREQIASKTARKAATVEVPEWGGEVALRAMSVGDLLRFESDRKAARHDGEVFALLVAAGAVDDQGQPLFSAAEALDLGADQLPALTKIGEAVIRLNGLGEREAEEAVGNS